MRVVCGVVDGGIEGTGEVDGTGGEGGGGSEAGQAGGVVGAAHFGRECVRSFFWLDVIVRVCGWFGWYGCAGWVC